jgi:adenylate kinase family enzyme
VHRNDDNPEVITQRLAAYDRLTAPILAYFGSNSHRVDGTGTPDEVFHRIRCALQQTLGDRVR